MNIVNALLSKVDGLKTVIGAAIVAVPEIQKAWEAHDFLTVTAIIGAWLMVVGGAHKADKVINAIRGADKDYPIL